MRSKKILWMFNHYAVTPELPGGTRHFDFAMKLSKRRVSSTIFASSFNYNSRKEEKLTNNEKWREETFDQVKFLWIKTFPYEKNDWRRIINMLSYAWRTVWIGFRIKDKPEVILGSSVHLLAAFAAYVLARLKRTRFILEIRDLWPQTLIDLGNYSEKNLFIIMMRKLERFLYKRAEKIIVLLPNAVEYIEKLGIQSEKIVWIPNGVDLKRFSKQEVSGGNNDLFIIMYMGAHGRANALDVILEAAEIVENKCKTEIQIHLVGDGPEKERLERKASQMGLKTVRFRDSVPKEKVAQTMQEARGFIFSLEEASVFKYGISSNKLWEYMASCKPVIFSCDSINNPIEEAKAGITIQPNNPIQLAEAMIKIVNLDRTMLERMGRRGRKYVEDFHDIEKLAEKFLEVLS